MRGDLLDLLLAVAALLSGVSGYRRGLVVGALSLAGLVGGGLLGAQLAPGVTTWEVMRNQQPAIIAAGTVLVLAAVGQLLAGLLAARFRSLLVWRPLRLLDAVAGTALSVTGLLLVAWLLGSAVASGGVPALASQVRRSMVIAAVDRAMPERARAAANGLRRYVGNRDPDVFGRLAPTRTRPAAPPDPALAAAAAVVGARPAVVKVTGNAPSCDRRVEGSGFAYAPGRVMTNAHVVAGVRSPVVQVAGRRLPGRVVLFDPDSDVAVLYVPGLPAATLDFTGPAARGEGAVVVGFPQDGPFRADAARIRETQRAQGPDIYGSGAMVREVYALRALVQPGNSGGPLLGAQGGVLGMVFASAADRPDTGYALTARQLAGDAALGRTATTAVDTRGCD